VESENEIVKQAERHPNDARWIRARALALLFQVNLPAAESELRRAQRLDPQGDYELEFGLIAFERQDYNQAIDCFSRALARDPASTSALFNRAVAYRRSGLNALARADFERILATERDPSSIAEIQRLMQPQ
jgi:tetratricopeptide (TPR) repeat protein